MLTALRDLQYRAAPADTSVTRLVATLKKLTEPFSSWGLRLMTKG
ncbi:hypothetical protein RKD42_000021 [Streptomyces ambofaciens]